MTKPIATIGPGTTGPTAVTEWPTDKRKPLPRQVFACVALDGRSDDEIRTELKSRLAKLRSGDDRGLSFEEVFGEPLLS